MKRTLSIFTILLLIAAVPAVAGSDDASSKHKKCSGETQVCLNHMVKNLGERGWVGIELNSHDSGALEIARVEPDSPAETAGLKPGDLLTAMNGIQFSEENEAAMKGAQAKMTIGATVTYSVDRAGYNMDLDVKLGAMPDVVKAKWIGRHMLQHATVEIASNN